MADPLSTAPPARRGVAVFCGSAIGASPAYAAAARALGEELARVGARLVYGGASVGLMGAVADAALAHGGEVVGVIPSAMVERELAHRGLSRLDIVGTMHERKARMAELSDGIVALPGGFGTLDETFEMLTWAQLGISRRPVVLFDVEGFYQPLVRYLDHATEAGFVRPAHRALVRVADTAQRAVAEALSPGDAAPAPKWG